jgi:hypothetical protein
MSSEFISIYEVVHRPLALISTCVLPVLYARRPLKAAFRKGEAADKAVEARRAEALNLRAVAIVCVGLRAIN